MRESGAHEVDWAAVKAVYEAGEVPVREILAKHCITEWQLKQRRLAEGWKVRRQLGRPALGTISLRPIEAAVAVVVRLMELHVERLAAVPGPVPEEDLVALTGLGKVAEGLLHQDTLRRQPARPAAARKSSPKSALDGGRSKEEEARAADVEWMRAELKRRLRVLAGDAPGAEGTPDRQDGGAGA